MLFLGNTFFKLVNIDSINVQDGTAEVTVVVNEAEEKMTLPRNIVCKNKTYIKLDDNVVCPIDNLLIKVNKVFYHDTNNGNSCCSVVILKTDNSGIIPTTSPKIKGVFPTIYENEELNVCGFWQSSEKDKFFKVLSYTKTAKLSNNAIIDYLCAVTTDVKRSVIKQFVENYNGNNLIEDLKNKPDSFTKSKGISKKTLQKIINGVNTSFFMEDFFAYTVKFNINSSQILCIYNKYKMDSKEILKENPYKFVGDRSVPPRSGWVD